MNATRVSFCARSSVGCTDSSYQLSCSFLSASSSTVRFVCYVNIITYAAETVILSLPTCHLVCHLCRPLCHANMI